MNTTNISQNRSYSLILVIIDFSTLKVSTLPNAIPAERFDDIAIDKYFEIVTFETVVPIIACPVIIDSP